MRRLRPCLFLLLFLLLLSSRARGEDLVVVRDGHPQATIVLSAHSLPAERRGAEELRWYVKEMSGASLVVITDDQPLPASAILVGHSRHTDKLGVKLDAKVLGDDGFVLKT